MPYLAVIPLGAAGVATAGRLLITPLVVLKLKPEMLSDRLFDV
jgi:hypothetical protein